MMKNPTISADSLAQLTGYTVRWLRDLAASGHIPKSTRGNYPRDETLKRLFAYLRERTAPNAMQAAKLDREQSRARKEKIGADLLEKKVIPLDAAQRERTSATMTAKFRLYGAAEQIGAELGIKFGFNSRQSSTLRAVVSRHHNLVVRDLYAGDLVEIACPHCHQHIEPPEPHEQMKDLPAMYRDAEWFAKAIEYLAKNNSNITTAIQERKKLMTLNQNGTWNEPQFLENTKEENE